MKRTPFGPRKKPMKRTALSTTPKGERAKAKKKAWAMFSVFIRMRDSDANGMVKCVTCKRVAHWTTMDAGHFITRAKECTLMDERNVHAQCKGCNQFQGGMFFEHEKAVERIHGPGTVTELKTLAGMTCKRTARDYFFLEGAFKALAKEQLERFPGKARP